MRTEVSGQSSKYAKSRRNLLCNHNVVTANQDLRYDTLVLFDFCIGNPLSTLIILFSRFYEGQSSRRLTVCVGVIVKDLDWLVVCSGEEDQ